MRSKTPRARIKKSFLGTLLSLAVFASTIPITTAQQEQQLTTGEEQQQQLQSQYEAELTAVYNDSGGSKDAVFAHVAEMINDMAFDAMDFEPIVFDLGDGGGFGFPEESGEAGDTQWRRQQQCKAARMEECRRNYNAELAVSAAAAIAVAAGCVAVVCWLCILGLYGGSRGSSRNGNSCGKGTLLRLQSESHV